jgi:hypothetical protein
MAEDVGGSFGSSAVQAVRKSPTQPVQISADELKKQIGNPLTVVGDVFDQPRGETGMMLDGVELSIEQETGSRHCEERRDEAISDRRSLDARKIASLRSQ